MNIAGVIPSQTYLLEDFIEILKNDGNVHVDNDEENDQDIDNEEENSKALVTTVTRVIFTIIGHGFLLHTIML